MFLIASIIKAFFFRQLLNIMILHVVLSKYITGHKNNNNKNKYEQNQNWLMLK